MVGANGEVTAAEGDTPAVVTGGGFALWSFGKQPSNEILCRVGFSSNISMESAVGFLRSARPVAPACIERIGLSGKPLIGGELGGELPAEVLRDCSECDGVLSA